jgi:hypothetical protein
MSCGHAALMDFGFGDFIGTILTFLTVNEKRRMGLY